MQNSHRQELSWLSSSGKFTVSRNEWVAALIPFCLIVLIWAAFWISPDFYFTYLLEKVNREYQVIEILTFLCAALAAVMLFWTAYWFREYCSWESVVWIGIMAFASLFFAGEEISWGQSYFSWDTPDWWGEHISRETNFHNSRIYRASTIRLTHWGGIFLLLMFVVIPVMWVFQHHVGLSFNFAPAMLDFGSMMTIVVASLYRESKNIVEACMPSGIIYEDFLWGFSEHREMLVAVGLLLYAISRWRTLKGLSYSP